MFSGLQSLTPPAIHKSPKELALLRERRQALQVGLRVASARNALMVGAATMKNIMSDFSDVRRLRAVINTYGLNKAVMVLVNPNGRGLSKVIPNLPSTESLDNVGADTTDPRAQDTLSGIDTVLESETGVVAEWVRAAAESVEALIEATEEQVEGFDDAVNHYIGVLNVHAACEVDPLVGSTLETVPCDDAMTCVEALLTALPKLHTVVRDPTDRDAMEEHVQELSELVECIGEHTGLCLDPGNPHHVMQTTTPDGMVPVSSEFDVHGYTIEKIVVLLERVADLLQAIGVLVERKTELVNNLDAAANMVTVIDNDVPPATDDAISDGEGDEALSGGNTTQTDLIHCHVSSHLCCITSITDAAVKACQNALCVADQIDVHCSQNSTSPTE